MKFLTIGSIALLAFISILSLSSQYITVVNLRLLCSFTFLISISVPTFFGQSDKSDFFKQTLLFISPLFFFNGNHINAYLISYLILIYLISLVRLKFNIFGKSVIIIYIAILCILTIGLFTIDYLNQKYKNEDNIDENYLYSPNNQNFLNTKVIDEGGLGSSSYIILYKNKNSHIKQEIEICYNKSYENINWNNNEEFNLDGTLFRIDKINLILPRPISGKCIDNLD
jgi:hypothetical protein